MLSSIFMADSVVKVPLVMAQWSSLFLLGELFQEYLSCFLSCSVLGYWKVDNIQIFLRIFLFVAVDTFQHYLLGLPSLCFGFSLGRVRSKNFLLCFQCHLHEKPLAFHDFFKKSLVIFYRKVLFYWGRKKNQGMEYEVAI